MCSKDATIECIYGAFISQDPCDYSPEEANEVLRVIHDNNAWQGGLSFVCEAKGVLGCFRLLECYYLLLLTQRERVGDIAGELVG